MLKKTLMTAAAALAITAGATTLSTSDANARGRVSINPSGGEVGRGYTGGRDNIRRKTYTGRFTCHYVRHRRHSPAGIHHTAQGYHTRRRVCY